MSNSLSYTVSYQVSFNCIDGPRKEESTNNQAKGQERQGHASYTHRDRNLDEDLAEEENIQRMGRTIRMWPDSPLHISEFDSSYMRNNTDRFDLIPPQNSDDHRVVDYSMS